VPVWVNVRIDPVPDFRPIDPVLIAATLDASRHISNLFALGFFARSFVLTPDGKTLLNPSAHDVTGSVTRYLEDGHFAYAEVKPREYLTMLFGALEKWGEYFPAAVLGSK
jgi:hypothetical protein